MEQRKLRVRGVALIVQSPHDWKNILIIRELESKPHLGKYPGMFSIPMETSRPDEEDEAAIARLVSEELPGFKDFLKVEEERRGVYRITPGVWVSLYVAQASISTLPTLSKTVGEVEGHAWMRVDQILKLWLRQGAREMLTDYADSCTSVVCKRCKTVSSSPQ
jgi:hypothetical protein